MPILFKNNPMPLDGALFVTNPRKGMRRRANTKYTNTMVMRHTGMSRKQVEALKSSDYDRFQELFKEAGGEKARKSMRDSRPERWEKFKSVISKASKKSSSKKSSSKRASGSRKVGGKTYKEFVTEKMRKGMSMSDAAADWREATKTKSKKGSSKSRRKNPLVPGSQAAIEFATLQAKAKQGRGLSKIEARKFQDLLWAASDAVDYDTTHAAMAGVSNAKKAGTYKSRAEGSKGMAGKTKSAKSSVKDLGPVPDKQLPALMTPQQKKVIPPKLLPVIAQQTPEKAAKTIVGSCKNVGVFRSSKGKCSLMNVWCAFLTYKKAREAKTGRKLSNYQYYYGKGFLPAAIAQCVKDGYITAAEGKKLLAEKRKQYSAGKKKAAPKVVKASKPRKTTKRKKSVAKKKTSSTRLSKKITSLTRAVNRGEIDSSIKNKVNKGTLLQWGEFQRAFSGCGHTSKALGRMYKAYRKAHGGKLPVKSKTKTSTRRKRAAGRSKGSKASSAIDKKYILKVLKARRKKEKGVKVTLSATEKKVFEKAVPHIQRLARKFMREGASKYAAVNKAITRARSRTESASGKRRRYKGVDLRMKKAKRFFNNPRRRKNAAVISLANVPVIGSLKPLARLDDLNATIAQVVSGIAGKHAAVAYSAVNQGLKLAEISGLHFLFGSLLDKPIDSVAAWVDKSTSTSAASWLANNAYYSLQGLTVLLGIGIGQRLDLLSRGSALDWGVKAFGLGVAFDVASWLQSRQAADKSGVHLNGYAGGQYIIGAPQSQQLRRTLPYSGYGAIKINPGDLHGAEGVMGHQGAMGPSSYGATLFSGDGY